MPFSVSPIPGDAALDEVRAHRLRLLEELVVALADGADVDVVDGDVGERQRAHDQLVLLDRVHAAELRAQRVADGLVARAGAHDVGDPVGHLAVARPQHRVVRARRREQPFHLHARDHVLEAVVAVLGLEVCGEEREPGRDDHGADVDVELLARACRGRSRPRGRRRCTRGTPSRRRSRGSARRRFAPRPRSAAARARRSRWGRRRARGSRGSAREGCGCAAGRARPCGRRPGAGRRSRRAHGPGASGRSCARPGGPGRPRS